MAGRVLAKTSDERCVELSAQYDVSPYSMTLEQTLAVFMEEGVMLHKLSSIPMIAVRLFLTNEETALLVEEFQERLSPEMLKHLIARYQALLDAEDVPPSIVEEREDRDEHPF